MTDYSILDEARLIQLYESKTITNESLDAEWSRRFLMSFPYKLDSSGNIVNCVMGCVFTDDEADQVILRQAKQLRRQRADIMINNRVVD